MPAVAARREAFEAARLADGRIGDRRPDRVVGRLHSFLLERRLEQTPILREMKDARSELFPDPEGSVAIDDERFGIEVGAGQHPLARDIVDEREPRVSIGIGELDERRVHLDAM